MWRVLSDCIDERISSGLREFSDVIKCCTVVQWYVVCCVVLCCDVLCCVVMCCVVLCCVVM
jgi:hypothetical protein